MENKTIQKMYNFFSSIPGFWELDAWTCRATAKSPYRARLIDKLGITPSSQVLDVACGTGLNFNLLQKALEEKGRLVGIDQSKKTLALAHRKLNKHQWNNAELIETDSASFRAETPFDCALCTFAIEIIPPWKETIDMMINSVCSGGRIGFIGFKPSSIKPYTIFNGFFRAISVPFGGVELDRDVRKYMSERTDELFYEEVYGGFYYILVGQKR